MKVSAQDLDFKKGVLVAPGSTLEFQNDIYQVRLLAEGPEGLRITEVKPFHYAIEGKGEVQFSPNWPGDPT